MISFNYLKGKLLHYLEYIKNSHLILKTTASHYPQSLHPWCGVENIHLHHSFEKQRPSLIKKYTRLKGELDRIKLYDERQLSYDDHVSRIKVQGKLLDTAMFIRPTLSETEYETLDLNKLPDCSQNLQDIINKNPQLHTKPAPFDYSEMEKKDSTTLPVCVGLPEELGSNYVFNESQLLTENVLHLPIKISADNARELLKEGRVLAQSRNPIEYDKIYLPKELKYLMPLIKHACQIERQCNPEFMNQYYIFLSVSHSIVQPGTMQRRGGWHIDGHQGYERLQKNGKKLPCDRQYLISNVLPTESIHCRFDFNKLREYCKKNYCDLDSINMQDVIEQQASAYESNENIMRLQENQLNFLNPYMAHRAVCNHTDKPITRTFARILFSTFTRNRLGDSINPILGPVYPLKIKTIKDIHEIPSEIYLS
ncbi:hypothetical protein ACFORL_09795 [Legionella dresdenensis]|uniref:Uncharacterized protein n=1 Tax=Legionella dresdenensis TaxID=450200 RepID=A0ABV8CGL2_9GAMM